MQDNGWGISVTSDEARMMDAYDYAGGFPGMKRTRIDGSDFEASYTAMAQVVADTRNGDGPYLVQAKVPLLGHHTSGVRKEFYRTQEDLDKHGLNDPGTKLRQRLVALGVERQTIIDIERNVADLIASSFQKAIAAPEPSPTDVAKHVFAPTPITEEKGDRSPFRPEK